MCLECCVRPTFKPASKQQCTTENIILVVFPIKRLGVAVPFLTGRQISTLTLVRRRQLNQAAAKNPWPQIERWIDFPCNRPIQPAPQIRCPTGQSRAIMRDVLCHRRTSCITVTLPGDSQAPAFLRVSGVSAVGDRVSPLSPAAILRCYWTSPEKAIS